MDPPDHSRSLPLDRRSSRASSSSQHDPRQRLAPLPLNIQAASNAPSPHDKSRSFSAPINVPHPQPPAGRSSPGSVHDRPVNPPITPHQSRTPAAGSPTRANTARSLGEGGVFAMEQHRERGVAEKHRMPTFGGGSRPGAFAVYDPATGETNDGNVYKKVEQLSAKDDNLTGRSELDSRSIGMAKGRSAERKFGDPDNKNEE